MLFSADQVLVMRWEFLDIDIMYQILQDSLLSDDRDLQQQLLKLPYLTLLSAIEYITGMSQRQIILETHDIPQHHHLSIAEYWIQHQIHFHSMISMMLTLMKRICLILLLSVVFLQEHKYLQSLIEECSTSAEML